MNDTQLMNVRNRCQDWQGNLQGYSLLRHGPALLQQLLKKVPSRAVLHDNVDLLAVLERRQKSCDQRHPAFIPHSSLFLNQTWD